MKKQLLLTGALLSLFAAQAQVRQTPPESTRLKTQRAMVKKLLSLQQGTSAAARPTGIQYRVKAQTLESDFSPADSFAFKYSGTRNSTFDYNYEDFAYNTYLEAFYAPLPTVPYAANPLNLQVDSMRVFNGNVLQSVQNATYRPDNKIIFTRSIEDIPNTPYSYATLNEYNSAGNISKIFTLEDSDTLDRRNISYDATNTKVATDSFFNKTGTTYELQGLSNYFYNAQSKLDSIIIIEPGMSNDLEPSYKVSFDYYSDGKIRKVTYNSLAVGSSDFPNIDSFGYTTGIPYVTLYDTKFKFVINDDTINYQERVVKYPGTNGLPDSSKNFDYDEVSNSWEEYSNAIYTYTAFNAPETITFFESGTQFAQNRFYYETYDDGIVSVKNIGNPKDFAVYPNPFRDHIAIEWKGEALKEKVSIKLVNSLGQQVYQSQLKLSQGINELNLPNISVGNYILSIQSATGETWSHKMIKK